MFSAILAIAILFITDLGRSKGIQFRPINKIVIWLFGVNFAILMILGACHVENPFIAFGQISTVFYFFYFIIIGVISLVENSLMALNNGSTIEAKTRQGFLIKPVEANFPTIILRAIAPGVSLSSAASFVIGGTFVSTISLYVNGDLTHITMYLPNINGYVIGLTILERISIPDSNTISSTLIEIERLRNTVPYGNILPNFLTEDTPNIAHSLPNLAGSIEPSNWHSIFRSLGSYKYQVSILIMVIFGPFAALYADIIFDNISALAMKTFLSIKKFLAKVKSFMSGTGSNSNLYYPGEISDMIFWGGGYPAYDPLFPSSLFSGGSGSGDGDRNDNNNNNNSTGYGYVRPNIAYLQWLNNLQNILTNSINDIQRTIDRLENPVREEEANVSESSTTNLEEYEEFSDLINWDPDGAPTPPRDNLDSNRVIEDVIPTPPRDNFDSNRVIEDVIPTPPIVNNDTIRANEGRFPVPGEHNLDTNWESLENAVDGLSRIAIMLDLENHYRNTRHPVGVALSEADLRIFLITRLFRSLERNYWNDYIRDWSSGRYLNLSRDRYLEISRTLLNFLLQMQSHTASLIDILTRLYNL
jgi:hypothetical protein